MSVAKSPARFVRPLLEMHDDTPPKRRSDSVNTAQLRQFLENQDRTSKNIQIEEATSKTIESQSDSMKSSIFSANNDNPSLA